MCTRPIRITKVSPLGFSRQYNVRCGRCEECRKSYRNEFAAMVVLAASRSSNLDFFTFTYRSENLPFMVSDGTGAKYPFLRGLSFETSRDFEPIHVETPFGDPPRFAAPSLCRKDLQDVFKVLRSVYKDAHFKYAFFGEYGEERARPHYHGLVCGLSDEQSSWLCSYWRRRFGFSLCKHIPAFNPDGSPGFVKTAQYVSKYVCKKNDLPQFVLDGYAELPRRQSSVRFGSDFDLSDLEAFENFISPVTFPIIKNGLNESCRVTGQSISSIINFPFHEV